MTLRKCGATIFSLGRGRAPVIALFLRDGVFWFLAVLLVSIVEIVLWDRARPTLAQIPVVPATSLMAVIGARVVLNIIKHATSNTDINVTTMTGHDLEMPVRRASGEHVPWYLNTTNTNIQGTNTLLDSNQAL